MKNYTLKQISDISDCRNITKHRFEHYCKIKLGFTEEKSRYVYEFAQKPPYKIQILNEETNIQEIETIADLMLEIYNFFKENVEFEYEVMKDSKPIRKRVYFKTDSGDMVEADFDLNCKQDIILYADMLKSNIPVKIVDFFERINNRPKNIDIPYINIYDGDVFAINDDWHKNEDGDIYLCVDGGYRKLLYIFGHGYILNGKPNYDEDMYVKNHYALTLCKGFKKLGNIYVNANFLTI